MSSPPSPPGPAPQLTAATSKVSSLPSVVSEVRLRRVESKAKEQPKDSSNIRISEGIPLDNCSTTCVYLRKFTGLEWVPVNRSDSLPKELKKLKVATLNCWMIGDYSMERIDFIVNLVYRQQIDIISLQEWSFQAQKVLEESEIVRSLFIIASQDSVLPKIQPSGQKVIFLVRRTLVNNLHPEMKIIDLPLMNSFRKAVSVQIDINSSLSVIICGVHLQSESNLCDKRALQLKHVTQLLRSTTSDIIVLGDYNFHHSREDNVFSELQMVDMWKHLGRSEKSGMTFHAHRKPFMRLDRIGVDSGLIKKCPKSTIELFAADQVKLKSGVHVYLSDHFGITATFQF